MTSTLARLAALAGSALLATALLAGCGSDEPTTEPKAGASAPEERTSERQAGAAAWLAGQLEDGFLVGEYGPDPGLSIDAALALAEVPGHEDDVQAVAEAVAAGLAGYTTGVDFGSRDTFAGSVAKAAVLADVAGQDPSSYGGTDLVQRLEELVADDGPTAGRLADDVVEKDGADYANVIGQVHAVRALTTAGSPEAAAATKFLLAQQCEAGHFRLYFAPADAPEQGCDAGTEEESAPDTDVTALAVLALAGEAGDDEDVDAAVTAATDWLLESQGEDGGFGGATSTEGPNANSTGLAGWALMEQGETESATAAAEWLAQVQVEELPCGDAGSAEETGGVAYDAAALESAAASGVRKPAVRDQWRRATAQAVPVLGLVGDPVSAVEVSAAGPAVAGEPVELEVDGLRDGEQACLTGPGRVAEALTGTGDPVTVEVVAPRRAGAVTYVLHRLAGPATTTVEVGAGS